MIVDTMVLAYALLGVEGYKEQAATALDRAKILEAPDSLKAELTNVIWQWMIHRDVSFDVGRQVLRDAAGLVDRFVPVEFCWERALILAVEMNHRGDVFGPLPRSFRTRSVQFLSPRRAWGR